MSDGLPVILNVFVTYLEIDYDQLVPNSNKLKFYINVITTLSVTRRLWLKESH